MRDKIITQGDVLLVTLPSHDPKGHEQEGYRPVIVVAVPQGELRYPVLIVVPLTTKGGLWLKENPKLYQQIPKGAGGLPRESIALIDQIRSIDVQRIKVYLGSLDKEIFQSVQNSLLELFRRG